MRTVNFPRAASPVPSLYFINKIEYRFMSSLKCGFPMLSHCSAATQKQINIQRLKR